MRESGTMTTTQAAAYLAVTERRVRQLLKDRRLRGSKVSRWNRGGEWVIEQRSVEEWDVKRRNFEAILHERRVTWGKTQSERQEQEHDSAIDQDDRFAEINSHQIGAEQWAEINARQFQWDRHTVT
jgi:excisionase family DNA binding protein